MHAMTEIETGSTGRRTLAWRLLPLAVLALMAALFFASGLHRYLTFDMLRAHRAELAAWVGGHHVLAAAAFMAIYAATVVFVPPSGTVLTVMGGFVFGAALGTAYVVVGATAGATLLFLVARFALGDWLREKAGPGIRRMRKGFAENAMSYLLVLRLVPLFPFWLVNLAPAFLGVRLGTYVLGTLIGIVPGTAVYAVFGAGLGSILDANQALTLSGVLTPQVVGALAGLGLLALVPVVYKKFKARAA